MTAFLSRFAPDRFTMLLIATVALATVAPPTALLETPLKIATDGAIALMFFLYGARLATSTVVARIAHWRLHALVLASTFVLFPIIGLALRHLPAAVMPPPLAMGMLFLCVLPSTIQSSLAFTSIAGGNVPAAMCSATLSSLVGTVLTPALVALLASAHGAAPMGDAIVEICLLLLLPFLAGQLLRRGSAASSRATRCVLGATDRGSILFVVYGAFGHAVSAGLWHVLPPQGFVAMIVARGAGAGDRARRHALGRGELGLRPGGHDRHRVLRLEEEPRRRRADGRRAVPGPGPRHDPAAGHAVPPDAADGLRGAGPALGAANARAAPAMA